MPRKMSDVEVIKDGVEFRKRQKAKAAEEAKKPKEPPPSAD